MTTPHQPIHLPDGPIVSAHTHRHTHSHTGNRRPWGNYSQSRWQLWHTHMRTPLRTHAHTDNIHPVLSDLQTHTHTHTTVHSPTPSFLLSHLNREKSIEEEKLSIDQISSFFKASLMVCLCVFRQLWGMEGWRDLMNPSHSKENEEAKRTLDLEHAHTPAR